MSQNLTATPAWKFTPETTKPTTIQAGEHSALYVTGKPTPAADDRGIWLRAGAAWTFASGVVIAYRSATGVDCLAWLEDD